MVKKDGTQIHEYLIIKPRMIRRYEMETKVWNEGNWGVGNYENKWASH